MIRGPEIRKMKKRIRIKTVKVMGMIMPKPIRD